MWAKDRHHLILAKLSVAERVSVDELVVDMQVSRETIRRDIVQLEGEGRLRRVHGGAERAAVQNEPMFEDRKRVNAAAKKRIGIAAARLVQPGMMVALDAGTSTLAFATAMAGIPDVAVITNSVDAAHAILAIRPDADMVLIGGRVVPEIPGTFGEMATTQMRRHSADLAIFSPVAVSADRGATDFHMSEADFARAMITSSKKVVALADGSKLGGVSRVEVCTCREIDTLVTDKSADAARLDPLRVAGLADIITA
ncbi:DeoR/GlpR family DNA-binding transcription regulator [Pseudooceanicola sp. CBS1P-1]|uniref:DeoR family transcriptional regulator n=1 Tax=Pseudooceanicola albus TaxID=2692189 RepID=A0A6L7G5N7_9RHOB|nr:MULTISPECIES: DeoR/GlpR family DNA-binding transcription regulator [Pseudooceanicola]MBT9385304.1 DeoR/GlpR family DNA-binding transcription regulator [Pseudooceanicola endophyticus]MXN18837.1 DeoR family transcriptional regulator [Pseudooceanicola albus]